jgi:hypothetical protein
MIVGDDIISFFVIDFGEVFRCFIERFVFRILFVQFRFDADDDDEFKLVFVDIHLSFSPEFAANVANA